MGSSGSGKSTLMAMLGCLDRPTSGNYFFDGVDVAGSTSRISRACAASGFGFVFQSFNLLPRTSAIENVALPLFYAASGPGQRRLAHRAGARGPGTAWTWRDRERNTPGQLSGGQQQRVAIARALINEPESAARRRTDRQSRYAHFARDHGDAARLNREQGVTIVVVTHEPTSPPTPIAW